MQSWETLRAADKLSSFISDMLTVALKPRCSVFVLLHVLFDSWTWNSQKCNNFSYLVEIKMNERKLTVEFKGSFMCFSQFESFREQQGFVCGVITEKHSHSSWHSLFFLLFSFHYIKIKFIDMHTFNIRRSLESSLCRQKNFKILNSTCFSLREKLIF